MPAPGRPPANKVKWFVWLKRDPKIFAEVEEQFWMDARVLGACDISSRTGQPIFFDELEAAPANSNLVHLEVERMRRGFAEARACDSVTSFWRTDRFPRALSSEVGGCLSEKSYIRVTCWGRRSYELSGCKANTAALAIGAVIALAALKGWR